MPYDAMAYGPIDTATQRCVHSTCNAWHKSLQDCLQYRTLYTVYTFYWKEVCVNQDKNHYFIWIMHQQFPETYMY